MVKRKGRLVQLEGRVPAGRRCHHRRSGRQLHDGLATLA
jgi:hypothetical protein